MIVCFSWIFSICEIYLECRTTGHECFENLYSYRPYSHSVCRSFLKSNQISADFRSQSSELQRSARSYRTSHSGAPNVNFRKISVRKTIWDLEFLEHFWYNFLLACLSENFWTSKKWYNERYNCSFLTEFNPKKVT